jgi:serine/threonine-protein kinase
MALRTIDDLIEALQETQLLSPSRMDVLLMSLRVGFVEPADLAEDLVLKRWLTLYQAKEVFRGRARELLLGKYVLLDRLAAGGMALVFKAQHRRLHRIDAVKIIRPDRLQDPRVLHCFLHEAEAAARLSHRNVVRVYDADEADGRHFLAMEYVEGIDLERLVKQQGPLAVPSACDYARQAAEGIHHAHERGLIHRDVKPSNLLLTADGALVKVVDLGMALLPRRPPSAADGAARTVMGTPDYLAPEQADDPWNVDVRADVYGLGCTFYFLLTGRPPFPGGSAHDKLRRHREARATRLERLRRDLPEDLAKLIRRMLAKKPGDRIQTLAEVAEALRPWC